MREIQNEQPIPGCRIMNKDSFWRLIEEVKNICGQSRRKYLDMLKDRLKEQGVEYAQDFHDIVGAYSQLADKYGLWSAMKMIGHSSYGGFTYFRSWLISQGKEAYFAALKDPDSLVELDAGDGDWFENFAYAGAYAIKELTGEDAFERTDWSAYKQIMASLEQDIEYDEGIDYPFEWDEMAEYFPRLYGRYIAPGTWQEPCQKHTIPVIDLDIWDQENPEIKKAREAGPPLKLKQKNDMEMGGM